jgi:hypothetical protein
MNPNVYSVTILETSTRRILSASSSGSTVSGNGTTNMEPFKNYTVTVDAKNSGGTLLNTGGDNFFVRIQNECTITDQVT